MRVNIENCSNNGDAGAKEWVLEELVKNLKELRDRTDAGDMKALDEFFGLFVFNDDQSREKVRPENERIDFLVAALKDIGDWAHDRSTGPAIEDDLWEVRRMAYDAMDSTHNSMYSVS